MFDGLLKRLIGSDPAPLPETDARLALAALLVRIARSDGDYAAAEIDRIDRIIASRYDLTPDQARSVRIDAEQLETEAPDTVRFTRAIKNAVPYEDRKSVVAALWDVVLVDGIRDDDEDALLRLLANLLGVNDRDSNIIRKQIENRAQ